MTQEEGSDDKKGMVFFGRNLNEIPCFKSSFLTGILSGVGFGLAHFLATSRVKRSADVTVYSFVAITFGYWCWCRYKYSSDKFLYKQLQSAAKKATLYEGTEKDKPQLDDA